MATITTNRTTTTRSRQAFYWATTGVGAFALAVIGAADLVRAPAVVEGLAHLGYPAYFATILGAWQLLGAAAIVAPGLPRVKEWAYAGMFFTLSGAALSHAVAADPVGTVLVPLALLGVVVASWALQPAREARFAPAVGGRQLA